MNRKTLLSLSIASILSTTTAIAQTNTQQDDDSVSSWGPWAGVKTAAGPSSFSQPLLFAKTNANNAPRSNQVDTQVSNTDNSGYRNYASWGERAQYIPGVHDSSYAYGTSRAELKYSVDGAEGAQPFYMGKITGSFTVTNEGGDTVSTELQYGKVMGYHQMYGSPDGYMHAVTTPQESYESGTWNANHAGVQGGFFQGTASSIAAINALANTAIQGNGTATYSGNFVRHGVGKSVNITVNFGQNASWRGDFHSRLGTFSVENGNINGVDLQGTVNTPGGDGPGFTGTVDASFFGSSAGTIAGITDVTKGSTQFVEVFKTNLVVADVD